MAEEDCDSNDRTNIHDKRKSVEIPVPWSSKLLRIRNYDICVVVLVSGAAITGYFLHGMDGKQTKIVETQQTIIESLNEATYVLTLTPAEREKLDLQMPGSLRKKLKER